MSRGGEVVAARSMFVSPGRSAWLGIEAPVPGIMTPSTEDDRCLLAALVAEAERHAAPLLVADVEAPTSERDGPAYDRFAALEFRVAYRRGHYVSP